MLTQRWDALFKHTQGQDWSPFDETQEDGGQIFVWHKSNENAETCCVSCVHLV